MKKHAICVRLSQRWLISSESSARERLRFESLRDQITGLETEQSRLHAQIDEAEVAHSAGERSLQMQQDQISELEQQLVARQLELESLERDRTSRNMELSVPRAIAGTSGVTRSNSRGFASEAAAAAGSRTQIAGSYRPTAGADTGAAECERRDG